MRGAAYFLIVLLAALGPGSGALAQAGPEGLYVARIMETATGLELAPGGRFRWGFSQGALDLSAEGRWRLAEDGAVLLDTEPEVRPPVTELLGTGRERGRAVTVRIADANGRTPEYLTIEAAHDTGEPEHARIDGEAYRFEPGRRRIVSVRIIIPWSGYVSEPFPLPAGDNVVRLRFAPNDLGRADFRGERLTREGDTLILNLFSQPISYRRLSAEELAEEAAAMAAMEAEAAADASASEPPPALSPEDAENDRICVNEGLVLPRAQSIAGCTALIDGGRLPPAAVAIARVNRGNILTDDGQFALAIADFDEALRLDPEMGMAYWGRAGAHEGLGDFARAVADSREAARRLPDDPVVLNSLCWQLAIAGEALDEARAACDSALALRPDDADTLDSRGLVGLKQGRFREARADFDAALRRGGETHENRASFYYGRGIATLRLGRERAGQADLARATALDAAIAETYARHGVRP